MTGYNKEAVVDWAKENDVQMDVLNELLATIGMERVETIQKVRVTVAFDMWVDELEAVEVEDLEVDCGSISLATTDSSYRSTEGYSPELVSINIIN